MPGAHKSGDVCTQTRPCVCTHGPCVCVQSSAEGVRHGRGQKHLIARRRGVSEDTHKDTTTVSAVSCQLHYYCLHTDYTHNTTHRVQCVCRLRPLVWGGQDV